MLIAGSLMGTCVVTIKLLAISNAQTRQLGMT